MTRHIAAKKLEHAACLICEHQPLLSLGERETLRFLASKGSVDAIELSLGLPDLPADRMATTIAVLVVKKYVSRCDDVDSPAISRFALSEDGRRAVAYDPSHLIARAVDQLSPARRAIFAECLDAVIAEFIDAGSSDANPRV